MKKRLTAVLTAMALMITGCSGNVTSGTDNQDTQSNVSDGSDNGTASVPDTDASRYEIITATEMAEKMGLGISLGNTMEAYEATDCEKMSYEWIPVVGGNEPQDYETCWGADVTTQEIIDGMKAEGFSTVRIPVFWGNMMENDGTYTINKEYLARVKEIVDYCEKAGVYSVINIHHFDEFIIRRNDLDKCKEIFTHLWTQIAEYFADYPYTLVFEGYNEYLGGDQFDSNGNLKAQSETNAYKMTNTLNQAFVDAVRNTGGYNAQRVLIVSGYWTNIDKTTSARFTMPEDLVNDRLMVSVHYVDNSMYWANKIGGEEWLKYIDSQCAELKDAFLDNDIPVFMGETTSTYPDSNFAKDATHTDSSECLSIVLGKLTDLGIVPVIWDTNSHFYSRTTYKIVNESDRKVIREYSDKLKANLEAEAE